MSHGPSGLGGATLPPLPACAAIFIVATGSASASASIIKKPIFVFIKGSTTCQIPNRIQRLMTAVTATATKTAAVMSPAKSPAIVVSLLTGAILTGPAGTRPQITQINPEKEFRVTH